MVNREQSMDYLLWVVVDELSVDEHVHVMLANHFNLKIDTFMHFFKKLQVLATKSV